MEMEPNQFFRNASIRICGNLDLKEAMKDFLHFIKDFIPVDYMDLKIFDPNLNLLKTIASVARKSDEKSIDVLPMPDRDMMGRLTLWDGLRPVEIINRPALHPDIREMFPRVGKSLDCSIIIMRIDHDGRHVADW